MGRDQRKRLLELSTNKRREIEIAEEALGHHKKIEKRRVGLTHREEVDKMALVSRLFFSETVYLNDTREKIWVRTSREEQTFK